MGGESDILILGASEMTGAALERLFIGEKKGKVLRPGPELDYGDGAAVEAFFQRHKPSRVLITGGRSGGILANQKHPADLMDDNLRIVSNVLKSAHQAGTRRLLYLGSACCYPKLAPSPLHPRLLGTGPLEPTNAAYGEAKLAGIALCAAYRTQHGRDFFAAIPANPYGPGDDFSPEEAHVIGALIRKVHEAKISGQDHVEVWGTGKPRREFLYADDLASGCAHLLEHFRGPGPVNVGSGEDSSIGDLAFLVRDTVSYKGDIRFDTSKPDGMMERKLDGSELRALGWKPRWGLAEGLAKTYEWFLGSRN